MKKTLKRGMCVLSSIFLTVSMSACFLPQNEGDKDNPTTQANIQPDTGDNENGGNSDSNVTTNVTGASLSERICGDYFGQDSYGDGIKVSIYNVFDNLYANVGYTDSEGGDIYSFWATELFPINSSDILSSDATGIDVGGMSFSVMSNMSKYFHSPVKGKISLTNDGIEISSIDGNPLELGGNIELKKSDGNEGFFFEDYSEYLENLSGTPDENLYGIWREKYSAEPRYIEFKEEDGKNKSTVYQKESGREVFLAMGEFTADTSHVSLIQADISTCAPEQFSFDYKADEDSLVISGSTPLPADSYTGDSVEFERITKDDVPLCVLCEPDDTAAIKGGFPISTPDGASREVCIQFCATDDIENNGTYFVRVGNVVYFRYYTELAIGGDVYAPFGEFLNSNDLQNGGCIGYYDLATGETGIACFDGNAGELYYLDGRFYSEKFVANDYDSQRFIERYWPNGGGLESYTEETAYSYIRGINENNTLLAISNFDYGENYTCDGTFYFNYLETSQFEDIFGSGFIGNDFYTASLSNSSDGNEIIIRELDSETQNTYTLFSFDASEFDEYGYPMKTQFLEGEDGIYVGISWFDGTAVELSDYCLVKVQSEKEDSGEFVEKGFPIGYEEPSEPYAYFDDTGDVAYTPQDPDKEAGLSSKTFGDLVEFEAPFGYQVVDEGLIPEYPFDEKSGVAVTVFEDAQKIKDNVFVILAYASYEPSQDIGWRRGYKWLGFSYMVYTKDGVKEIIPTVDMEP